MTENTQAVINVITKDIATLKEIQEDINQLSNNEKIPYKVLLCLENTTHTIATAIFSFNEALDILDPINLKGANSEQI